MYKNALLRILDNDHKTVIGTAFLISKQGLALTCSHILVDSQTQKAGPFTWPETIPVSFYVDEDRMPYNASVVKCYGYRDGDIAVLKVDFGALTPTVLTLTLSDDGFGEALSGFGFTKGQSMDGTAAVPKLIDTTKSYDTPILQFTNANEISQGFSGAPVVITNTNSVIGMVKSITELEGSARMINAAFAIPAEVIGKTHGLPYTRNTGSAPNESAFELPTCLIDRQDQDEKVILAFNRQGQREGKPASDVAVGVVYGHKFEEHDHYVLRLERHSLRPLFTKNVLNSDTQTFRFDWPRFTAPEDFARSVLLNFTNHVPEDTKFNKQAYGEALYRNATGPLLIHTYMPFTSWKKHGKNVEAFMNFWSSWPAPPKGYKFGLLAIALVTHEAKRTPAGFEAFCKEKVFPSCAHSCHVPFPELDVVEEHLYNSWCSNPEVLRYLKQYPNVNFKSIYKKGENKLQMRTLLERIQALI